MVQNASKLPSELAWKTRQAHADKPAEPEGLRYLIGIQARHGLGIEVHQAHLWGVGLAV
jgi:hypothetical protein